MIYFKLPNDFLMGSATAATQIEGGDRNSNWFLWCEQGRTKDGSSCLRANDHWNRYREDIELMRSLNHKIYRMGLEWSRIEPEKGRFDDVAIAHYRSEIELLIKNGIKPLVTLHHFSHPVWVNNEGSFEKKHIVGFFNRYVKYVVEKLGDLVEEYITINEPNVYAVNGYLYGEWPPGKKNFIKALKVMKNMTLCHIAAYKAIHQIRKEKGFKGKTMVGVANHLQIFDPFSDKFGDRLAAKVINYLFQDAIVKSMTSGRLRFPVGIGSPEGRGRYYDFIGINYYTRYTARLKGFQNVKVSGVPRNDLGWEIYPEGLYRLCREYYEKYKAPIWITENGTCDSKDTFRSMYIYNHLFQVYRLNNEGIPVERYYHWTLMDNFEWAEGESARFGLYHTDFETQKRTLRKSGEFFGEICRTNSVTQEMAEKYLVTSDTGACAK